MRLINSRVVVWCGVLLGLVGLLTWNTGAVIGSHAGHLLGLMIGGYEHFTELHVRTTLEHLARNPVVQKLDPEACELMKADLENNRGFFAVLALGDAEGNSVCTADTTVREPLPTMADRTYFIRAKAATGLVTGEYTVSRTTGQQVLHFAYPIRDQMGEFRGIILAAVDLGWYADPMINQYFDREDVLLMAVDQNGKLLYGYPAGNGQLGETVLTAHEASVMFAGGKQYRLMRGYDGAYRIYAYRGVEAAEDVRLLLLVGVGLRSLWRLVPLVILLSLGTLGLMRTLVTEKVGRVRRGKAKS